MYGKLKAACGAVYAGSSFNKGSYTIDVEISLSFVPNEVNSEDSPTIK